MPTLSQSEASNLFRQEPDAFIDVGEGEAAHRQVGQGPDVLFVHGWPVTGATFRCLLPHLVDHVRCHVVDLPGTGSSRYDSSTHLSIDQHIESVKRIIDHLDRDSIAVVGHDSGGMIARHAVADDTRLHGLGLINTEPPNPSWRFTSFVASSRLPGFGAGLGWVAGKPRLRKLKLVLGDAFADRSRLDGEFDEFFLRPLAERGEALDAAMKLISSFDMDRHVTALSDIHKRINAPVQLVWGDQDPFFPVARAQAMMADFTDAEIAVIKGSGLFSHEETPEAVAKALLPTLLGER